MRLTIRLAARSPGRIGGCHGITYAETLMRRDPAWAPFGTVALQITASAALVAPPTSKDQCKDGGWTAFNNPSFENQGACVSYVQSHQH